MWSWFHLVFNDFHFVSGKFQLGVGSNNFSEFNALYGLLNLAINRGMLSLHIFKNSKLVIDLMLGLSQITNNALVHIGSSVKIISEAF